MTRTMEQVNATVSAIHYEIDNSTSGYFDFLVDGSQWSTWPDWYKRILNAIYFFAERDGFVYASSNVYEDGEHRAGQVVALTESLVVIVDVEHDDQPGSFTNVVAQAWPRSELVELVADEIHGDVTHERQFSEWPTRLKLSLKYHDGQRVTLPVTKSITRDAALALRKLYPSLLDDLSPTVRSN